MKKQKRTDLWHPRSFAIVLALGAGLIAAALASRPSVAQERCRRNAKVRMTATLVDVRIDGRVPPIGDPTPGMVPPMICGVRVSDERDSRGVQLDDCKGLTLLIAGGQ